MSILDAVWYRIISSLIYLLVDTIIFSIVIDRGYSIAAQSSTGLSYLSFSVILLFILLTFLDAVHLVAAFEFEGEIE